MLSTLLATYSSEKLKEIRVALQEDESGDISREGVEESLRQNGLATIADGLKENLQKGTVTTFCLLLITVQKRYFTTQKMAHEWYVLPSCINYYWGEPEQATNKLLHGANVTNIIMVRRSLVMLCPTSAGLVIPYNCMVF